VIQEKTFERVGSSTEIQVDVRIIAATHQDLEDFIRQGRFREDLYYRLNVIPILLPPLRERIEDIAELALYFLRSYAQRGGKAVTQLDDDALLALKSYHWPGNIRQLENAIERAVVLVEGPIVTTHELPDEILQGMPSQAQHLADDRAVKRDGRMVEPSSWTFQSVDQEKHERELLVRALAAADGNKAKAARTLGVPRSTLISRLKKHGLS
jgi:transcriptional regulator with PAS, ATPase and Fis domain